MWQLILITLFFAFSETQKSEPLFIILDDCNKWENRSQGENDQHFTLSREVENIGLVGFIYGWIDQAESLGFRHLTYGSLLAAKPIFSSDLSREDWYELGNITDQELFIMTPEDYCSERRFRYDHKFKLYEMKLYVQASSDDLAPLEIPIPPIPAVDTLRRKKNN